MEHDSLFPQRRRKLRGRENPPDRLGSGWHAQDITGELTGNLVRSYNELGQRESPVQTGLGTRKVGLGGTGQIEVLVRPDKPVVKRFRSRRADVPPARINHAPDINTRQCAKDTFNLIQAVHHKNVVKEALETGIYPRAMVKQATRLSDFIKPAAPNDKVKAQLADNTDSWTKNNMNILYANYEVVIQSLKYVKMNKVSLDIAKGWAGKRYGARLKASTFTIVESLLVLRDDERGKQLEGGHPQAENGEGGEGIAVEALGIDLNDEEQFPALPTQAPIKLNFAKKQNKQTNKTHTLSVGEWRTLME